MKISVRSITGRDFCIEAPKNETIAGVKKALYNCSGISPSQQALLLLGNPVEDTMSIRDMPINSDLILVPILSGGEQIFIKALNGKITQIDVDLENGKVIDIMKAAFKIFRVPTNEQKLVFGKKILDKDKYIKDIDIKEGDTIYLVPLLSYWQY